MYDKKNYDKRMSVIKSDPILHEKWKKDQRERHEKRSCSQKYKISARERTKKWIKRKKKKNPNFQKKENKRLKEFHNKQRHICIDHYSGGSMSCSCCGENIEMFLEIDHLRGGGTKHRKELKNGRIEFWLIKHNFPKGFGVLCCNCNKGKYLNGGICPHKS